MPWPSHIGFIIIVFDRLNRAEARTAQALMREAAKRQNAEEREREKVLCLLKSNGASLKC